MAEAKSGWIPFRFHHRIDTKKGQRIGSKITSQLLDIPLFWRKEEYSHSTPNSFSLQPLTLFHQNLPESHEFFLYLSEIMFNPKSYED